MSETVTIQNARRFSQVEEKAFKTMGSAGAANLVLGICILAGGIVSGILLIVHGARLLKNRRELTF